MLKTAFQTLLVMCLGVPEMTVKRCENSGGEVSRTVEAAGV